VDEYKRRAAPYGTNVKPDPIGGGCHRACLRPLPRAQLACRMLAAVSA
jgi:hypothetical protein